VAVSAGFVVASVGTETDGSIVCPAAINGVVGLKPTVGLLSGERIVPIAHSQDTPGPMTTSVRDAAILLTAMLGEETPCQPTVRPCRRVDYLANLRAEALRGRRIGVLRFAPGRHPRIEPIYEGALTQLREAGATLVEIAVPDMNPIYAAEDVVLHTEFKADLNAYLATLPATVPVRDLAQLIEFNRKQPRELVLFGQDTFEAAQQTAGVLDETYQRALADAKRLAGAEGIDRLLAEHKVDLLVAPTTGVGWRIDRVNGSRFPGSFSTLPAVAGYPHLTVPMGFLEELPLGISFIGPAWSEELLLGAGYAFEQRARARKPPRFVRSLEEQVEAFEPRRE
jgi:amidase